MFEAGGDLSAVIYAALGAAVMGIWTATSVAAGSALQRERWYGTLELLVAAPAHFSLVLLPLAFATSAIGIFCMATTLLWGRFAFGIDLTFEEPLLLALAIPATILSIGALGFLMAVSFARYRALPAIANAMVVALFSLLISALMLGIDGATLGDVSGLLASEAAVGVAYTVLGYTLLRVMEHESRKRASIQIA